MNKLFFGVLAILSMEAYAQNVSGLIEAGPSLSSTLNSGATSYGARIKYTGIRDRGASFYVPLKIELGGDVKKAAIGAGVSTGELIKNFRYSVAAAVENLSFEEKYALENNILEGDRKRVVGVLMQEVNFELNQRLSLGFHLDLDIFNPDRFPNKVSGEMTVEELTSKGYVQSNSGGYYDPNAIHDQWHAYPSFDTNAQRTQALDKYNESFDSKKASSTSSFGVSLKFRLKK